MKKSVILLLSAAAVLAGCEKDALLIPSPDSNYGGEGTVDGGSTGVVTPGTNEDDLIDGVSFARTITIVFSDSADAAVTGDENGVVKVNGNQVTVDNTAFDEIVKYVLSGSCANGSFKVYSGNKQAFVLDGLSLTSPDGPAINNQGKKRCFLVLKGENMLADAGAAAYATEGEEDAKAVLFSEGQVIVSGDGSLEVSARNALGKSAVSSDDYLYITGTPVLKVTAGSGAGHGLRGKDYVRIAGGTLEVTAQADMKKGINSDGFVLIEDGNVTVTVTGGTAYDEEDMEYTGSACIKADNYFGMTGGIVTLTNSGAGGKGIRAGNYDYYAANSGLYDSYITGGTLKVSTTGAESHDVSAKAIKIGFKEGSGRSYLYAGNLLVSGGSTVVTCSKGEAVEAKGNITVSDGALYATSSKDDAINCQGEMNVTGGYVYGYSSGNDGIDTNGNLVLSGGYTFGVTTKGTPEVGLDANTEGGYKLYIKSGATVVAYGGLESGYSSAQNVYSMSCTAGGWNALHDGSTYFVAFKAPSGVSSVAVSAPSLNKGFTGVSVEQSVCNEIWGVNGISGGKEVSLSTYSGGNGPGGGGPGYPGGPGWPW
jgi:hypothetical protein